MIRWCLRGRQITILYHDRIYVHYILPCLYAQFKMGCDRTHGLLLCPTTFTWCTNKINRHQTNEICCATGYQWTAEPVWPNDTLYWSMAEHIYIFLMINAQIKLFLGRLSPAFSSLTSRPLPYPSEHRLTSASTLPPLHLFLLLITISTLSFIIVWSITLNPFNSVP